MTAWPTILRMWYRWSGMLKVCAGGIEFRLSPLFPAVVVVMLTIDRTGIAAWCVAASLLHEAGHFLMLFVLGSRPAAVIMGIFGVRVEQPPQNRLSYGQEMLVSFAGPAVNLACAAVLALLGGGMTVVSVHLTLGLTSLLPVEPLDGGQILYASLAWKKGEEKAERVTFAASLLTLFPLAAAGFWILIQNGDNFSPLVLSLYLCLLVLFKQCRWLR